MSSRSDRMVLAAFAAAWFLLLASCTDTTTCTAELRAVIRVDILDSVTRAPAASGATVLIRGPFWDSLVVSDTSTVPTAHVWFEDRVKRGTYSLLIQKSGYRDWTQTGLRVEANSCHTTTFDDIVALLQH